jgi:hypothetical protein
MTYSHCQSIGNIVRSRCLRKRENSLNHELDLTFPGPSRACHGLLDLEGGILIDRHTGTCGGQDRHTPGLGDHQRCSGVFIEKQLFNDIVLRTVLNNNLDEFLIKQIKPLGKRCAGRCANATVIHN